MNAPLEGLVIQVDRKQCDVEVEGAVVACSLRGRFFEEAGPETRPVAVGDRVLVALDGEQGRIEAVLPRRNQIARHAPRERRKLQTLAANLDCVFVVVTLRQPDVSPGLCDRLLAAVEHAGIRSQVVLNKRDLYDERETEAFLEPYRALGYPMLATSALRGTGIDALKTAMRGGISLLLGHSGVGKSSLLNALDPALKLRVDALRGRGGKGRHTTTYSRLLELGFGAHVVDSPGIREFALARIPEHELGACFRELRPLHKACRYPTCTHDHEPGCAVKQAVQEGSVRPERYASYLKLLAESRGGGERMPRHSSF